MRLQNRVGTALIGIASLYLVLGVGLGIVMAMRQDFTLMSVHSHVNLLGWATMGLTGLVYVVLPECAANRLATAHFWLYNIGLPVLLGSLTALVGWGYRPAEPLIGVGSLAVFAGILLFAVNVFKNGRSPSAPRSQSMV